MSEPIRVLIVDDDPLVRTGLRMMLRGAGDIAVVAEVDDGAGVLDAVRSSEPAVVLMDVRMPRVDGIAATRALADTDVAVVVLTTFDGDSTVLAALRAGAAGYLLKSTSPEDIVAAIRRAAAGEPVLSPDVARTLISQVAGSGVDERTQSARRRFAQLTAREQDVAIAVAEGLSNAEIAQRLYVSVGSVKAHISSSLSTLDLTNRIQLALLAHDAGRVES